MVKRVPSFNLQMRPGAAGLVSSGAGAHDIAIVVFVRNALGNPMSKSVMVLNGPNLNLLGIREPDIYGSTTLADIEARLKEHGDHIGIAVDFRQSNTEGVLVDWIQEAGRDFDAIVINAGGYTHTSVAIPDALLAAGLPVIEVHLSNIFQRDEFRHHSYVSIAARGMICGLGAKGYELALDALADYLGTMTED